MSSSVDSQSLDGLTVQDEGPAFGSIDELPAGSAIGRYRVLEPIGQGGMGVVRRAYDEALGREVAIKTLRVKASRRSIDDRLEEIEREARALAQLSHPNVVAIFDVIRYPTVEGVEGLAIVMELLDGRDVGDWVRVEQPPWRRRLEVFVAAGRGIAAAHAVDLLHRDVKPSNIVVCEDGSVRVIDFGLARHVDTSMAHVTAGHGDEGVSTAAVNPTNPAVEGTPSYMSPEQHSGATLTPRSDQYNFCAALAATLGDRPLFSGDDLATLAQAKLEERMDLAGLESLPPRLVSAVVRGLAADPEGRYESMDALLDALTRVARPRRWGWAALGSVALVGIAASVFAVPPVTPSRCEVLASTATALWPGEHQPRLHAALQEAGALGAQTTERVDRLMEGKLEAWTEVYTRACDEASEERAAGEERAAVDEERLGCLQRELDLLDRTLDALVEEPTVAVVAVPALVRVRALEQCRGPRPDGRPVPVDSELARRVDAVRRELYGVDAQRNAARYPSALESAHAAVEAAQEVGYPPLRAEAVLALARVQVLLGDVAAARQSYEDAYYEASSADYDRVALRAAVDLVELVGADQAQREESERWSRVAASLLDRLSQRSSEREAIELLVAQARAANAQGHHDEGRALASRALQQQQSHYGPQDYELVPALVVLAMNQEGSGELEPALATHRRTLEIRQAVLGQGHPETAASHNNIAVVLVDLRRLEEARDHYETAIEIWTEVLGAEHSDVALGLSNLAGVYSELGDRERAVHSWRRALALWEGAPSAPEPMLAMVHHNLGRELGRQGKQQEGLELVRRSVETFEQLGHANLSIALTTYGGLLHQAGRVEDALSTTRRAVALTEERLGAGHLHTIGASIDLADLLVRSQRSDEAVALLRRSLARLGTEPPAVLLGARVHVLLGQIFGEQGRVDDALAEYRAASVKVREVEGPAGAHLSYAVLPMVRLLGEHDRHEQGLAELHRLSEALAEASSDGPPEQRSRMSAEVYEHEARLRHDLEGASPRVRRLVEDARRACAEAGGERPCASLERWWQRVEPATAERE